MSSEPLFKVTPRLDAPDRFYLLAGPQALWLGGGLASGPVLSVPLQSVAGLGPADVWGLPALWLLWGLGVLVGVAGAFIRPAGLSLLWWGAGMLAYALHPRRAVWMPVPMGERR